MSGMQQDDAGPLREGSVRVVILRAVWSHVEPEDGPEDQQGRQIRYCNRW